MGTVHGVYLKYVGISALSCLGYVYLTSRDDGPRLTLADLLAGETSSSGGGGRRLVEAHVLPLWTVTAPALIMGYSAVLNGIIAVLFKCEIGMGLLGKDTKTGSIPWWSYCIYFPFHLPTIVYTHLHTRFSKYKVPKEASNDDKSSTSSSSSSSGSTKSVIVPVATEVQPGWWVGGCYSHELNKDWAAVIDLTVEFPESCIKRTLSYLSLPTWDGVPCTAAQLEDAATFAVKSKDKYSGDVLVHCAHGRGRSTTVMCACLVKAGLYETWEEAFEVGIKPQRSVCKLNKRMKEALTDWQEQYAKVPDKKEQ